ncbi:MAG: DMT family transporter [Rhizobiaceae bacterium]
MRLQIPVWRGQLEFIARPTIAIAFFVFAMALIPLNDSLIKLMSDKMSVFQILGLRAGFSLLIVIFIPTAITLVLRLSPMTWLKLSVRGFCLVGAMLFFFLPLASLSLAEVTAIFFTAPLIISVLSVPILGEKLGIFRISAVIIGMVGVLIIVKPGSEGFQFSYLMPIASATSYAAFQVITRYIRNEAPVLAMVAVQNLIYFLTGMVGVSMIYLIGPEVPNDPISGFLLRGWETPGSLEFLYLGIAGLIVLNLSFASTNVYSNVEATIVAPFEYIALPTAVFWGILIWGDWPELNAWIGIMMIIGAGIFMIYRESLRQREVISAVPMRAAATNTVNVDEADLIGNRKYEAIPICF